ncbi:MAG: Dabb family protein [Lachnospiraceae bacterium]|nr:Dabb family protein [Lachnospiraceae bacterium]
MVKHVILWTLKDDYSGVEVDKIKSEIKAGLEGLSGKIPGLIDIRVVTEGLSTSNTDLMLVSTFEDFDALKGYSKNPLHVEVADSKVRPFTASRNCFDYEI